MKTVVTVPNRTRVKAPHRKLTFVIAPGIPLPELKALKRHWREAKADKLVSLITNYDMMVDSVTYTDASFLRVTAPDIPKKEVDALQLRVEKARTKREAIIFVNYDLQFQLLPKTGIII